MTASAEVGLSVSATTSTPRDLPVPAREHGGLPGFLRPGGPGGELRRVPHRPFESSQPRRPTATACPPATPETPSPYLTDPHSRTRWQQDLAARRAIATLWRYDPDPAATVAIQSQIDAAVAAGSAVARTSRGQRHYYCCPWSAIYLARQPVTIAGHQLRPMQEFTFDVSAEEMAEGGQFTRRLLVGPFHPTSEIDYCDPAASD